MSDHEPATPDDSSVIDHCHLQHPIFSKLPGVHFRRADSDGAPVMIVPLGDREAALPIDSLRHAFNIAPGTRDGQTLDLVVAALDYVPSLHPGDKLPDEVITGRASWAPGAEHRRRAMTRLRLQLLAWLDPSAVEGMSLAADLDALIDKDPSLKSRIQAAFAEAAAALELDSTDAVVDIVDRICEELAFIEALRDRLLLAVQSLVGRIAEFGRGIRRVDGSRRETIIQVQRLAATALGQYRGEFEEVDAQTAEIIPTLRNADSQVAYIRNHRDALYRNFRAWEPIFKAWDEQGADTWTAIVTTYQFLARRYLPVDEWPSFNALTAQACPDKLKDRAMAW